LTIDSRRSCRPSSAIRRAPITSAYSGLLVRNQRSRAASSCSRDSVPEVSVVVAHSGSRPTTERTFSGTREPSGSRSTS
jgi:hypothetical protein